MPIYFFKINNKHQTIDLGSLKNTKHKNKINTTPASKNPPKHTLLIAENKRQRKYLEDNQRKKRNSIFNETRQDLQLTSCQKPSKPEDNG